MVKKRRLCLFTLSLLISGRASAGFSDRSAKTGVEPLMLTPAESSVVYGLSYDQVASRLSEQLELYENEPLWIEPYDEDEKIQVHTFDGYSVVLSFGPNRPLPNVAGGDY